MKVLITGDQNYNNRIIIRKVLTTLFNKGNVIIATLGKQLGADSIIQQQWQQFGKPTYYFKLYCQKYNMFCLQQKYKFNSQFHPILYDYRNTESIAWCDLCIIFYRQKLQQQLLQLYNKCIKANKRILLINNK